MIGASAATGVSLGALQAVASARETQTYSPFTSDQLATMRRVFQQRANETIAASRDVSADGIPSWTPALPSAIPFNWCVKDIPFANDVCAIANSPFKIDFFECNGVYREGVVVSGGVAYGPSVSIEGDDFTSEIQNEANVDLFWDPNTGCTAVKFSSGPVEGCTGFRCLSSIPDPTDSIVTLANKVYDTAEDPARDTYEEVKYRRRT